MELVLFVVNAFVEKRFVDVPLVMTEEEARRVPVRESVLAAERYKETSLKEMPPASVVEAPNESVEIGVVVPKPRRWKVLFQKKFELS